MMYSEDATVDEALKAWDAGESIWSVEMGGLGPDYEQAIQVLIVELLREYHGKSLPEYDQWDGWGEDAVRRLNSDCGGFSGAQVGAAKSCAALMLKIGYGAALQEMKQIDDLRLIQICAKMPQAPIPVTTDAD